MQRKRSLTTHGPLLVGADRTIIHVSVLEGEKMDTIYVYGFPLTDIASIVIDDDSSTQIGRHHLSMPCFGPVLLVNGASRNRGVTIRARCEHGRVAIFGSYVRSVCQSPTNAIHSKIITNHLVLAHETLTTVRAGGAIDPSVPLTFVIAYEPCESILRLGSATVGTMKHVILTQKLAHDAVCRIVPCRSTFAPDALGQTQSDAVLRNVGESVSLIWTGSTWMQLGYSGPS